MSFIPYHSYTLHSTKEFSEVKQGIRVLMEPVQKIRNIYDSTNKPFEGVMKVDTFNIQRIHGFRKPFFPYTYGKIIETENGTSLKITTRLNGFVYFIFLFWIGFFSLFTVPFIVDGFYQSAVVTGLLTFGVVGMLLFQFHIDDKETHKLMQRVMQD